MYETTLKKEAAKQAERRAQVRQDSRGATKATRRPKTDRRDIKYTACWLREIQQKCKYQDVSIALKSAKKIY